MPTLDETINGPAGGVGQVIAVRVKSHNVPRGALLQMTVPGEVRPAQIEALIKSLQATLKEVDREDVAVIVHGEEAPFTIWRGGNWELVNNEIEEALGRLNTLIPLVVDEGAQLAVLDGIKHELQRIEHARGIVLQAGGCAVTLDLDGADDAMSREAYDAAVVLDRLVTTDPALAQLAAATRLAYIRPKDGNPAEWEAAIAGASARAPMPMGAVVALEARLRAVFDEHLKAEGQEHDLTVALGLADTFRWRDTHDEADAVLKQAAETALFEVAAAKAKVADGGEA